MAKKATTDEGNGHLQKAIALLIQNEAAFLARLSETDRLRAELERRHLEYERETAERFSRIEVQMAEIIRVLNEHGRILERLPEAVGERFGFKT